MNPEYARKYICESDDIRRIEIAGTHIFGIDLNEGWCIQYVEFDHTKPAAEIDELVVGFIKRSVYKSKHEF